MNVVRLTAAPVLATALVLCVACSSTRDESLATSTPATLVAPSPTPLPAAVEGLFREPRPRAADVTATLGPKPSQFPAWDGASTVLYDIAKGTALDLGPGARGEFSPDGHRMVWASGPAVATTEKDIRVIDVATKEQRSLGRGTGAQFPADDMIYIQTGNSGEYVNVDTGERRDAAGAPFRPDNEALIPGDLFLLRRDLAGYPFFRSEFTVTDRPGRALLRFEAMRALPVGRGWLAVATTPAMTPGAPPNDYDGTTNIFLVEIATGRTEFVATSRISFNWPFAASADHIVWTDDYCPPGEGRTRVYERNARRITELDATLWVTGMTPLGLIATGAFGPRELIDPVTFQYATVLPGGEPAWSADFRYASVGYTGGHGGLCG